MFLAICFDKQILLFWTNIPKLLCAASFHPSHQVFFGWSYSSSDPPKIGLPLATCPTCFPVFSLSNNLNKTTLPGASHSSMVFWKEKGVENLQYESFGHRLGAQFSTGPMIMGENLYEKSPDFVAPPPKKEWFTRKFTRLVYTLSAWLAQLRYPRTPLAKQGSNRHYLGFCKPFLPQKNGFC